MDAYREIIRENIDYDILLQERPHDAEQIDGYVELMLEVCCSTRDFIRISKEELPADALKALPMEQRRGSSAAEALQYFAKIAAWEKKLEGVTPEERYKKRQEKENRLDPYAYLLYIFRTAPQLDRTSENWVLPLLPENAPDECKVNI